MIKHQFDVLYREAANGGVENAFRLKIVNKRPEARTFEVSLVDAGGLQLVGGPLVLDAAPEQVRGEPVTTLTDVYSLGVVLFEVITGRKPYRLRRLSDNPRLVVGRPYPPTARPRQNLNPPVPTLRVVRNVIHTAISKLLAWRRPSTFKPNRERRAPRLRLLTTACTL